MPELTSQRTCGRCLGGQHPLPEGAVGVALPANSAGSRKGDLLSDSREILKRR